jgi:hypothetical protein
MAKVFDGITERLQAWLLEQPTISPRPAGVRSVISIDVTRVSDSCGFGVPLMSFEGHRPTPAEWAERKGPDGLGEYRVTTNAASIDGLPGLSA